jgi:diguanylate cyclase (GGDEF)-like protein/putative nucleotidyltransferase with HDIG domain
MTILPRRRSRRTLLVLVYGASLALVTATAGALYLVVGEHVSKTAVDSTVAADRSLVRSFAERMLAPDDLRAEGPGPARAAEVAADLASLVGPVNGILQIKIHSLAGEILFSDRPILEGGSDGPNESLDEAIASGESVAELEPADGNDAGTLGAPAGSIVIEEYMPILDDGGKVLAVFEIYRDAAPVLSAAESIRRDVLLITAVAVAFLVVFLHVIFRAAQTRLARQTDELLEAQRRDALTGMFNHGTAVELLAAQIEETRRDGGAVGVALVDIDNFRLLNDTHGHLAGDTALREVAAVLRGELSDASILGRYGPDELIVVAPPNCSHDLEPAIERLRARLADLSLQFGRSERLPLTVSAGICFAPVDGDAATELLSVATIALGEAKGGGGDGVRVARADASDMGVAERSSFDVLVGLVIAVDTKDRYTKRHSEDVARYALFLADRIGVDPELRRTLSIAGLLHDVGKIGIPDVILRKPAALTADEYEIVKQHVALGDSIVRDLPNLDEVRAGIRHHHERWDGTGYLDGLNGEAIPLIARILAVADAFSAMTTSRPYRKALPIAESLRRLEDAVGSQLDPALVGPFVTGIETAPDAPLPGDGRGVGGSISRLWTPGERVA